MASTASTQSESEKSLQGGTHTAPTFADVFRHMSAKQTAWWGFAGGALVVAIVAATLLGFGFLSINNEGLVRLDSQRVALQIQTEFKENDGVSAEVRCPSGLVAPKNFSFKCMAQAGAAVTPVNVTILDNLGNILWLAESPLPADTK
jgi:hypothetical protein